MLITILTLTLYLVLLAIVVYTVIWALGKIGVELPPRVVQLLWVAVVIIALIYIITYIVPGLHLPSPGG